MRVLVTGGAGFIGSHCCKALAEAGHEVAAYDNLSTGHAEFLKWGDFVHGDVRDQQKLRAALRRFKPDAVMHFASFIEVGESVRDPGKYYRNNGEGALSLLEAMRDEGIHNLVASSTAAVYGAAQAELISEATPQWPINPYGWSKFHMERMLEDFHAAHGLNWTALRYFNAAGASSKGEIGELHSPETHLIPRIILAALGMAPEVGIFGTDYPTPDGTCVRDYIHVEDLASAHILACERLLDGGSSGAMNLGGGVGASVREVVEATRKVAGRDFPVKEEGRRPGDPARLVADAGLARSELGWKPEKDLDSMVRDAWNFLSKRQGGRAV